MTRLHPSPMRPCQMFFLALLINFSLKINAFLDHEIMANHALSISKSALNWLNAGLNPEVDFRCRFSTYP